MPSHTGIDGNEQADKCALHGASLALPRVIAEQENAEVWGELGLEEMPEYDEDPEFDWDAEGSEGSRDSASVDECHSEEEMQSESEESGSDSTQGSRSGKRGKLNIRT